MFRTMNRGMSLVRRASLLTHPVELHLTKTPGRMFSVQQQLPHFPVPTLQQTLDKYMKAVEPILSDEDYTRAGELVGDMTRPGGLGQKLQKLLEQKAKSEVNWLEEWWMNTAYLEYRMPNMLHVSPGITLPSQDFSSQEDWLRFAARMVAGISDYKSMIDDQSLPVEKLGGRPLCMKQFYSILSSSRIPGKKRDSVVVFTPESPRPPKHFVAVHNNAFFSVPLYTTNGARLTEQQIYENLCQVVNMSPNEAPPVGILTSEHRNTWGKVYEHMIRDKQNHQSIDEIQRSVFLLCLDKPVFKGNNVDKLAITGRNALHGMGTANNSCNRWADKTLQFIASGDGCISLCYEHSCAEGPPIISVVDHMMDYINAGGKPNEAPHSKSVPAIKPLTFNINHHVEEAMQHAKEALDATIEDLDVTTFSFTNFGKNFIKSQKVSPDAFIQVSLQLAYFRLYGKNTATYESGSLRQFQGGRTEVIRSCSVASDAYCRAVVDGTVSYETRGQLLRDAISAHRDYTAEVMKGNGIDRHLLGLKLVAVENGMDVPSLFMDPVYGTSVEWKLSTSQVPSKQNATLLFAPVVPNGYGFCYNPMPDCFNCSISSWNSSPETETYKLKESLVQSFLDGQLALLKSQKAKL